MVKYIPDAKGIALKIRKLLIFFVFKAHPNRKK